MYFSQSGAFENICDFKRHRDVCRTHCHNFCCYYAFVLPFFRFLLPLRPSASYNYCEQNTVSTPACTYTVTTELSSGPNRIEADWTPVTGETKART